MWLSGQWFGPEVVENIAAIVRAEPSISRTALSRSVCEELGWRGPSGELAEVGCRKALAELARRGVLQLPAARAVPGSQRAGARKVAPPMVAEVCAALPDLGKIEVAPVGSRHSASSRDWNGMMQAYHYLGCGPLVGAQLRYLIHSEQHGLVGGLSFSAATLRLQARDEWIGWSEVARRANLHQVVCNSRFLIVPGVQVPNLASHVLALGLQRLGADWQARYGYDPVLVETFVDGERFAGTCYRAAGWQMLGETAARPDGFTNGKVSTGKKQIYAHPLREDWQAVLRAEPRGELVVRRGGGDDDSWAAQEFAGSQIFDGRLRRRLITVANQLFKQPGAPIPQAMGGDEAASKAAYRLFDNDRIDLPGLLKGHVEASIPRVREHKVVLAVQDTTTLNYTTHPSTIGLGPISTKSDPSVGLIVHDTMAFSLEGTPLGLLDVQCWARDPEDAGKRERRKQLPIEQKESVKWLHSYRAVAQVQKLCADTMLVSVGDREADIHELFVEALAVEAGPEILVRAERSRQRKVDGAEAEHHEYLFDEMAAKPLLGKTDVLVPPRRGEPARTAQLEVRATAVTLRPPKGRDLPPVTLWAVYAQEVNAGADVKSPLEWLLLTTVQVSSFDDAIERLRWYALRWGIEVFHRILKSGVRVEDIRLRDADRIERCLAIDMVVAWRIFWLTKLGRECPELPCDVVFTTDEWEALCAAVRHQPPPPTPPPLREAIEMVAKLGGFRGRKSDGAPGTEVMWRGLVMLGGVVIGYTAARRQQPPDDA